MNRGRAPQWFELNGDYVCNNACVGCHSATAGGPSMSTATAARLLRDARGRGAKHAWFGGGEPTLRRDLPALIGTAKRLGYERIKIQTNGMRLSYGGYTRELAKMGATEVSFSLKGARAETHDRLTQTPGCHALLWQGVEEARSAMLALEADFLAYASNCGELCQALTELSARGFGEVRVWALHATPDQAAFEDIPRLSQVVEQMRRAVEGGFAPSKLRSLHTPPCLLDDTLSKARFFAADLDLEIATPGGHPFWLENSPFEGGTYLSGCKECFEKPRCLGVRAAYTERYGTAEFTPLRGERPCAGGQQLPHLN